MWHHAHYTSAEGVFCARTMLMENATFYSVIQNEVISTLSASKDTSGWATVTPAHDRDHHRRRRH